MAGRWASISSSRRVAIALHVAMLRSYRAPFEREKLVRSISVALRKRPVEPERLERMVSGIVRQLESMGETELASHVVGEMVMKALKSLDEVAYVRYASVYRDFRETQDFAKFLGDEGLSEEVTDDEGEEPKR